MTRFFRGSMRYGAAILWLLALVQLLVGFLPLLYAFLTETGRMAENYSYVTDSPGMRLALQLQTLFGSLMSAALPFFGALVIDRLDRWLALRAQETAA